jgi:hypothetical protein
MLQNKPSRRASHATDGASEIFLEGSYILFKQFPPSALSNGVFNLTWPACERRALYD